jgi:hypothetical protein
VCFIPSECFKATTSGFSHQQSSPGIKIRSGNVKSKRMICCKHSWRGGDPSMCLQLEGMIRLEEILISSWIICLLIYNNGSSKSSNKQIWWLVKQISAGPKQAFFPRVSSNILLNFLWLYSLDWPKFISVNLND